MMSLEVELAGIKLGNPTILASGMMGETGESLLAVAGAGAGALVTKSIGREAREGYANPTLVELDEGYINAMGLPNPGIEAFEEEMRIARRAEVPIFGSIFAADPEDFAALSERLQQFGAAAIEVNLSCPHAVGYGMEVGVDPEAVKGIIQEIKEAVTIPVFAKLTPNTHRLVEVGKAVQAAGGDGVVAINTLRAMAISVEARRPVLSNKFGGLSGPAVKPVGLRCVYELYEALDIPVIGAGGVESWRDAAEYLMAGASAVQVGSAIGRKGLGVFRQITDGLSAFLAENRYHRVSELVGEAHE
jgi:dihydroorotate dehydrogenase (NAD+) catalytic subunit